MSRLEELPESVVCCAGGNWSSDEVWEANLVDESEEQERVRRPEQGGHGRHGTSAVVLGSRVTRSVAQNAQVWCQFRGSGCRQSLPRPRYFFGRSRHTSSTILSRHYHSNQHAAPDTFETSTAIVESTGWWLPSGGAASCIIWVTTNISSRILVSFIFRKGACSISVIYEASVQANEPRPLFRESLHKAFSYFVVTFAKSSSLQTPISLWGSALPHVGNIGA